MSINQLTGPTVTVTIEIDTGRLGGYTDQYLALLWHVAQANPAPHGDKTAAEVVQKLGWEIIRRWLAKAPPEMYHHKPQSYYWSWLTEFARYKPGGPAGTPEWDQGIWVPKEAPPGPGEPS